MSDAKLREARRPFAQLYVDQCLRHELALEVGGYVPIGDAEKDTFEIPILALRHAYEALGESLRPSEWLLEWERDGNLAKALTESSEGA